MKIIKKQDDNNNDDYVVCQNTNLLNVNYSWQLLSGLIISFQIPMFREEGYSGILKGN